MGRLGPGACKRKRAIGNGVRLAAWLASMILAAGHYLTYTCYTGCRPLAAAHWLPAAHLVRINLRGERGLVRSLASSGVLWGELAEHPSIQVVWRP